MRRARIVLGFASVLALSACGTTEKAARDVLRATPQGRGIVAEFDRYARVARVLKRYHDSGTLVEQDVLDVLRGAGVVKGAGAAPRPRKFPVSVYPGRYHWPLDAGVVSSEFGPRWGRPHQGIDIAADYGVPVRASAAGQVIYAGHGLRGYGNVVILRHDRRTTTLYAHNRALHVKAGDQVAQDAVVAILGSTGRSTGPHVHFELREEDKPVDPRARLPKSKF